MIDVLLAAYNGEKYLGEQLASLRAQTWRDFRVLMQDDGSTDATPRLLEEAARADSRFVLASEQGRHLGASGNFCSLMHQADADLIALCDQDDVWEEDRLSACAAAMADAQERWGAATPLLAHSDAALTDASGQVTQASFFRASGWDPGAVSLPRLLVQNNVTGCTVLINRALLLLARPDAPVPMHDWYLAQCAAAAGHIVFVPRPLVRYRQHGRNTIGAAGPLRRLGRALRSPRRARDRIRLTLTQAQALLAAAGPRLPAPAQAAIRRYLDIQSLPYLQRHRALREGGYTMQSMVGRIGQAVFG